MGEYIDKVTGKINQVKGDLTDDEATRLKGKVQEKKGEIKGAFERTKVKVKETLEDKDA